VYGGGAYDGRFNVDLENDSNMLYRAFALAGMNTSLKDVLVIGLSSGSWAQVLANDPNVGTITVVEINPGYFPLIEQHRDVQSLLRNPKVHIVIDDGRRWLVAHPERKFDFVLMNTTFNWRANSSNLLSTQFLRLIRSHLKPGGIDYYNTTSSNEAQATGANEFSYALRVGNFLAVSDRPIVLDRKRWTTALTNYRIDGRPVFDLTNALDRDRLTQVVEIADQLDGSSGLLESRASILRRTRNTRLITDDNMGTEWK
jgi:spermidine synthase